MSKEIVMPGTYLGAEEEYIPGENAYVDSDGNVFSDSIGLPSFDQKQHTVSVLKDKAVKILEEGTIVIGVVSLVKDNVVLVDMKYAEKDSKKLNIHMSMGVIAVFNAANGYVKTLTSLFKIGDIVKVRVAMVLKHTIELETRGAPELGVIMGFCTRCRKPLKLFDQTLKCTSCSNEEQRKISSEYVLK
jgi:exosome complex RNA-binding protein Csl4